MILPHEFAHAFKARLVGFQVSFRRIDMTFVHLTRTEWVRTKYLLFILAGPLANMPCSDAFSVREVRLTSLTLE